MIEPEPLTPGAQTIEPPEEEMTEAEERISVATAAQLMWWRFRKHTLAMISAVVLIIFYLIAISRGPGLRGSRALGGPTRSHAAPEDPLVPGRQLSPHVYAVKGARSPDIQARLRQRSRDEDSPAVLCQGFPLQNPGRHSRRRAPAGREGRAGGGVPVPSRHRRQRPRSVVAADVRHPDLAGHRPGGRCAEPLPGRAARRHLGLLQRRDRHRHPARHRDLPLDPDHSALDGPGAALPRTWSTQQIYLRSPSSSRCWAGPSWPAWCAAGSSPSARRTSSLQPSWWDAARCASSSATWCHRF